jgi:tRNA(Ile)-lysidine synthetase-like protein
MPQTYPKPRDTGGRLIRRLIVDFRKAGFELPITSHILIAVSGGSDSMALAHLILKYGRRLADPARIGLLHVNHRWRGEASDEDARFVARFGKKWGVPVLLHELEPPAQMQATQGRSLEEAARDARKSIFEKEAARLGATVLTAHQADDLAETFLWRLFTGAAETHAGGIAYRHGVELRPLLKVRKSELHAYLKEEKQSWREDSTNQEGRFLRSKMRRDLMPAIEELFPKAVEHLMNIALRAQSAEVSEGGLKDSGFESLNALLGASGLRMRRSHGNEIGRRLLQRGESGMPTANSAVDLPGGWRLRLEPPSKSSDGA